MEREKRKEHGMGDLPTGVAENDKDLDVLMESLEKGAVPSPEAPAPEPEPVIEQPPVVETIVDDEPDAKVADLEKQLATANQRFKTLEGMMKADRKRSAELVAGLEQQLEENRVAKVEEPLDVKALLTEDELAEFGEAGVAVLQKLAGAMAEKAVAKKALEVERELGEMRKRVEHAEAATEGSTTWDLVEKINPGAKEINASDVGWFEFLATADPVSGTLYRDLGEAAASVNDIQRLSELIDLYRESANLAKPAIPVKPPQTPVAPRNDGNNPPKETDKRVYSQDEIREFYDNRARNIRKGITAKLTAEQMDALEADIDAAMEEGRVKL